MKSLGSLVSILLTQVLLTGCGGERIEPESRPADPSALQKTVETTVSPKDLSPIFAPQASPPESRISPALKAKIDAFLAGEIGNDRESLQELVLDEEFASLLGSVGEPSEKVALQLASAMQLLVAAEQPDSEAFLPGKDPDGPAIGTDDPEVLRKIIPSRLRETPMDSMELLPMHLKIPVS